MTRPLCSARPLSTLIVLGALALATLAHTPASAAQSEPSPTAVAAAILAQAPAQRSSPRPPEAQEPDRVPLILYYGVAIILAGATLAAAVFPSKRSHQD